MRDLAPCIKTNKGSALIVALTFLSVLMIMTSVFISNVISSSNFESALEAQTKNLYIAEAGIYHAVWKLGQLGEAYKGESGVRFGEGSFDISIMDQPGDPAKKIIVSTSRLDGYPEERTRQSIRAVVIPENPKGGGARVAVDSWEKMG